MLVEREVTGALGFTVHCRSPGRSGLSAGSGLVHGQLADGTGATQTKDGARIIQLPDGTRVTRHKGGAVRNAWHRLRCGSCAFRIPPEKAGI